MVKEKKMLEQNLDEAQKSIEGYLKTIFKNTKKSLKIEKIILLEQFSHIQRNFLYGVLLDPLLDLPQRLIDFLLDFLRFQELRYRIDLMDPICGSNIYNLLL